MEDFNNNVVLGLYEDELVNADELQKFYWTGDFENTDGENRPYAVELEKADDKSELTSMEAGQLGLCPERRQGRRDRCPAQDQPQGCCVRLRQEERLCHC